MSSIDSDVRTVDMPGGAGARSYDPTGTREHVRSRAATWRDDSRKDPEELEQEIDETRADVQATLEALERRFAPERLLDQTIGRMRSHGGEFAGNLGHAMKQNPLPMLLTSIGIAWMMMSNRRNGDVMSVHEGDGGGMRERLEGARERWSGKAHAARERWSGAREGVRERLSSAKDAMRHGGEAAREGLGRTRDTLSSGGRAMRSSTGRAASMARRDVERVRSGFDHLLEEQPLVLGAIGIAAGAIVGAALPPTESEDRWIGDARDRALERAKQAGGEGYREARERAAELGKKAQSALEEAAGTERGRDERRDYDRPEDYNQAVDRRAAEKPAREQLRQPGSATDETPPI